MSSRYNDKERGRDDEIERDRGEVGSNKEVRWEEQGVQHRSTSRGA